MTAVMQRAVSPVTPVLDPAGLARARRILVLGSPGAGKTVLAAALSRELGLELLRLDDFFWTADGVRVPTEQWRAIVARLTERPTWVMDGTYEASLDLRLPAADAIVYLRSNRWVCLWRVVARRLVGRWRRKREPGRGHALTAFLVRYVVRFPHTAEIEVMQRIARLGPDTPMLTLHGRRDVGRFLKNLGGTPQGYAAPAANRPVGTADRA